MAEIHMRFHTFLRGYENVNVFPSFISNAQYPRIRISCTHIVQLFTYTLAYCNYNYGKKLFPDNKKIILQNLEII